MERAKNIVFFSIGLILLISIPLFIYFIGKEFITFLTEIDSTVAAAIIAASGTTLAAAVTVVIGQSINKKTRNS